MSTAQTRHLDGAQLQPGRMWSLAKNGGTLTCVLRENPTTGWEITLELNGKLLRSDVCQDVAKVWKLTDRWRERAAEKGWTAPT